MGYGSTRGSKSRSNPVRTEGVSNDDGEVRSLFFALTGTLPFVPSDSGNAELRKSGDVHADELARATGLDAGRLAVLLLQLELEGKVAALPGQKYALK